MQKLKGFDSARPYGDYEPLPKGGYVLKIANVKKDENSIGEYFRIRCDIEEGEYKGYYLNDYQNQNREDKKWHCDYLLNIPKDDGSEKDNWTMRKFKTFIVALEDSNEGYHWDWDEEKFKDKLIGGLFNEREYLKSDGSIGRTTNLAQVCDVDKVRSGNFKIPKDKLLNDNEITTDSNGFMNIPKGADGEIPFD